MRSFSFDQCIAHCNKDVDEFVTDFEGENILFIGAVGLDQASLYFAKQFSSKSNVSFKFLIERRSYEYPDLTQVGETHKNYLINNTGAACEFYEIDVITPDGATTGGRNVTNEAKHWFNQQYTDVLIDITGMSRGVFFPLVRLVYEYGLKNGFNVHLFASSGDSPTIKLITESSDRAHWMHGFQGVAEADSSSDFLKLWVPQLSSNSAHLASIMHSAIGPAVAEICPLVPFPSVDPKHGDELLWHYSEYLFERWEGSLLNIMYAHESDPLDAFNSIHRMHAARELIFNGKGSRRALTILSPSGWRVGSLGMLLAAIELDLPVLYVETIGYNVDGELPSLAEVKKPSCLWHIWLVGDVYENNTGSTGA